MDIDSIPILEIPEVQYIYNFLQRIESKLCTYMHTVLNKCLALCMCVCARALTINNDCIKIYAICFFLIAAGLDKVIRANVITNFELKSIMKRVVSKLESRQCNNAELTENDMVMIIPLLPL